MKGKDRQYTYYKQSANAMVERIKANPPSNLKVIYEVGTKLYFVVQTNT